MRDVALGQYFPGKSVIHRLDARVKIILLTALIVLIFITSNFVSLGITTLAVLAIVLLSQIPIKLYFKSMKMLIFIIIFTSFINLFYTTGTPVFEFGIFTITKEGIESTVFVCVRITSLILASSSLTFTTSPNDLTDAIERLMKPLGIFKIKVHEIAMMMTIALRFIPTLLEESDKIMKAQKARGADLGSGNIIQRIKSLVPILIPLFVSAFRRAYDLATAMECRCYNGGEGRTRMKSMHIQKLDVCGIILFLVLIAGVILCNIYAPL